MRFGAGWAIAGSEALNCNGRCLQIAVSWSIRSGDRVLSLVVRGVRGWIAERNALLHNARSRRIRTSRDGIGVV